MISIALAIIIASIEIGIAIRKHGNPDYKMASVDAIVTTVIIGVFIAAVLLGK